MFRTRGRRPDWQLSSESGPSESNSPEAGPKRRVVLQRSRKRLKALLARDDPTELEHDNTPLERGTFAALTAKRYRASWAECHRYCKAHSIVLGEAPEVDAALVEYMNMEYLGGRQAWEGEVLMSAFTSSVETCGLCSENLRSMVRPDCQSRSARRNAVETRHHQDRLGQRIGHPRFSTDRHGTLSCSRCSKARALRVACGASTGRRPCKNGNKRKTILF